MDELNIKCDTCGLVFTTIGGWRVHRARLALYRGEHETADFYLVDEKPSTIAERQKVQRTVQRKTVFEPVVSREEEPTIVLHVPYTKDVLVRRENCSIRLHKDGSVTFE